MGRKSSPMRKVVKGVCGAGFKTTWWRCEANIPISSQPKTNEYAENDGTGPDDDDDSFPLLHLDPEACISQQNY